MSEMLEKFSLNDCMDWNRRYEKATHDNNKKEIMSLLSEANHLYMDEYFIYETILKLNDIDKELDDDKKNEIIQSFNKSKIVKFVKQEGEYLQIVTRANTIKISKLSDIVTDVKKDMNSKDELVRQSRYSAEYISQLLTFPNSIVTGYIYGICDKSKKMHTWVEFKNNFNQEFVIDYGDNTIYNREGYYFLKHAEVLKKVESDELRGKSNVSKSDTSEITNQIIDIEIDMGDDDR